MTIASAASAQELNYKVRATSKTSTMQKEMQEAGALGYRFVSVMGGETGMGGKEVVVMMLGKTAHGGNELVVITRRQG